MLSMRLRDLSSADDGTHPYEFRLSLIGKIKTGCEATDLINEISYYIQCVSYRARMVHRR